MAELSYRGKITYAPDAIDIPWGGGVVFIGSFWPTAEPAIESFDAASLVPKVAMRHLQSNPAWKPLDVRLNQLKTGFELLEQTHRLADPENTVRRIQGFGHAVEFLEDDQQAQQLADDLEFMKKHSDDKALDKEDNRRQFGQRIKRWQNSPATAAFFEPQAAAGAAITKEQVVQGLPELSPAFEVIGALSAQPTVLELRRTVESQLQQAGSQIEEAARRLRDSLAPYETAFAALGSYVENAGPLTGSMYVINVPDTREAFQRHSGELVDMIRDLQLPFVDVVPVDPVAEADAQSFISHMGTNIHAMLWLSMTGYASPDQLASIAPDLMGTQEAGNIHLTAGKGIYRGIENVPMGPGVAGLRKRIDPLLGPKSYGCLEPLFARKGPKQITGYDDIDSLAWPQDQAMSLAQCKGVNAVIHNPLSNVATLALDRSRSNLERRRQATANRAAQLLVGCIRQYLTIEAPAMYEDDEQIRELIRKTKEKYFKYLDRTPGFEADLASLDGVDPGNLQLHLKYRIANPIESFSVYVEAV